MITRLSYFILGVALSAITIIGYPYVFPEDRPKAGLSMEEMAKARLEFCKKYPGIKPACDF